MTDLPQDQQPSQSQAPSAPASNRPQPSFPPMQEEVSPPAEEAVKAKLSSLGIKSPGSKKRKILLAAFVVIFILASVPAAVYLVQQRQEIRKAAVGYGDQAHSNYELTIGPDHLDYAAKGYGTQKNSSPTIGLSIPADSTVYKAYAIWGGERSAATPQDTSITISVNGGASQNVTANLASWDHLNTNYNTYQNSYLADITSLLPADTTNFTFSIGSFLENYINDGKGGAGHGIAIIIVYQKSDNAYSKIKLKLWGEYIRGNTSAEMVFNFADIDNSQSSNLKTAFFVGEAEGAEDPGGRPRPNFLFYNGAQLNPTDGTPFFGYSSDNGHWWDTRITGVNLPAITAAGNSARFWADSPDETKDPEKRVGDSIVWHGGIMAYAVTPPEALQCLNLTCTPDPGTLSPEDEITLTCTGSSDIAAPINHFEFRVSIDGGAPTDLGSVEATPAGGISQGQTTYTIPDYGCYKIECRACSSEDSSDCTEWGQAR